jgi:hypothetical protein
MKTTIVTKPRTTMTEPYTQLRPERIEVQERHGMLMLPKNAELQENQPHFWDAIHLNGILLNTDPAQLDAPLLHKLLEKVGIRIETEDPELVAALLNLDEQDPIFYRQYRTAACR